MRKTGQTILLKGNFITIEMVLMGIEQIFLVLGHRGFFNWPGFDSGGK